MISESRRCKMVTLLKSFHSTLIFFNDFNKVTILNLWFSLIMYGFPLFLFIYKFYSHNDIFKHIVFYYCIIILFYIIETVLLSNLFLLLFFKIIYKYTGNTEKS